MQKILIFILLLNLGCITVNVVLLWLPFQTNEAKLWRSLNIQGLRKSITHYRKINQPLSFQTYKIAKQNIIWHIILTVILSIQCVNAISNISSFNLIIAILSPIASLAWCIGSIVQRQKMLILSKKTYT